MYILGDPKVVVVAKVVVKHQSINQLKVYRKAVSNFLEKKERMI
jgi:hypothetical protein